MARRKRADLGTKEAQLEQALAQVKRLRTEVAEERRRAQRARNDRLAKTVTKLGLDEVLLKLDDAQCKQVAALDDVARRFEVLASLGASGSALNSSAGKSVEAEDISSEGNNNRSSFFSR